MGVLAGRGGKREEGGLPGGRRSSLESISRRWLGGGRIGRRLGISGVLKGTDLQTRYMV